MYQVLLFKFRRHLCKGSMTCFPPNATTSIPGSLFFAFIVVDDKSTREATKRESPRSRLQTQRTSNLRKTFEISEYGRTSSENHRYGRDLELVEISTDDLLITDMKSVVFTERP